MKEPIERHFYGFKNEWHRAENEKIPLEYLEPETVDEWSWERIVALLICAACFWGFGRLMGWI